MTWSNLYSAESKYNIKIQSSRFKSLLWLFGLVGFFCIILWSIQGHGYYAWLILVTAFILFAGVFIQRKSLIGALLTKLTVRVSKVNQVEHFILHSSGSVNFYGKFDGKLDGNSEWQLLPESRVGIFGAWLMLEAVQQDRFIGESKKFTQLFIFKDSVSNEDYARISRITHFVKNQSDE